MDIEGQITFFDERELPAMVTPDAAGVGDSSVDGLLDLLKTNAEGFERIKLRYGAILFRGFDTSDREHFARFVDGYLRDQARNWVGGVTPRAAVEGKLYESTRFPPEMRLPQHNEASYLDTPPGEVVFFCEVEPAEGGETPLADSRRIYENLDAEIREAFESKRLRYDRYYYGEGWSLFRRCIDRMTGLQRSWEQAFETADREVAERHSRELGLELSWDEADGAHVSNTLPATREHPVTGESLWFNQATTLLPTPRTVGRLGYRLYRLAYSDPMTRPFHVTFGDGEKIPLDHLDRITEATDAVTASFPWRKGDILLLDNFLMTHGRMPFKGERSILVAMR